MKKVKEDLKTLEDGEIPVSMNFTIPDPNVVEFSNAIDYSTFNLDYWIQQFDPELLNLFPQLWQLVEECYEKNKGRSALEEMNARIADSESKIISKQIILDE